MEQQSSVKTCRDTVLKFRQHVLGRNPHSRMLFAATSARMCWYMKPGATEFLEVRLNKAMLTHDLMALLVKEAGDASLLIQMHSKAKRQVTCSSKERVVSHLANALGPGMNLADFQQGNGRGCAAVGKPVLQKTGRDYVVWLGQR